MRRVFTLMATLLVGCSAANDATGANRGVATATTPTAPAAAPAATNVDRQSRLLRALEPLPHRRHGHCVERLGETLVLFGGFGSASDSRGIEHTWVFRSVGEHWSWVRVADLSRGRAFARSAMIDGRVCAIGEDWQLFDERNETWIRRPATPPLPRTHFAGAFAYAVVVGRGCVASSSAK